MIILMPLKNLLALSHFMEKQEDIRESKVDLGKPLRVCTDEALSMIGKAAGAAALLERFLGHSLLKYHCIIHQESVWKSF